MSFICSNCGKDWSTNYCPECGTTIDRSISAEKMHNDLRSNIVKEQLKNVQK